MDSQLQLVHNVYHLGNYLKLIAVEICFIV